MSLPRRLLCLAHCKIHCLEKFMAPLVLLLIRVYVGAVFFRSGMTKTSNASTTKSLFDFEYIPNWEKNSVKHWLGMDINFPVPSAEIAAKLSVLGELSLPVLLVLGFGGRLAAAGLFMMALVIELFVYPGMLEHRYWMICMAVIIAYGPGTLSIDYFIRRKFLTPETLACPFTGTDFSAKK